MYSVGAPGNPALTCQARPQDGEIFGEFPPRRNMTTYTKAPTIVPSSTPSCNSTYDEAYLIEVDSFSELETRNAGLAPLLALAGNSDRHLWRLRLMFYLAYSCSSQLTAH